MRPPSTAQCFWVCSRPRRGNTFRQPFSAALKIASLKHLRTLQPFFHLNGEGNGNPLQYSCLENPVDRGAWWAAVHRVAQSLTWLKWLSMHACVGEGNGNHSSILAWRIPWTEEPGGLLSIGLHRVGHDWSNLAGTTACWSQMPSLKGFNDRYFSILPH